MSKHPLAPRILRTKYLHIDWTERPDGRRWRVRRNRVNRTAKYHSIYMQFYRFEVTIWWR